MSSTTKAKLDRFRRAKVSEPTLPDVTVSKPLAQRVAQAFHTILNSLEPIAIPFRKSRSYNDPGYFERGQDRAYLSIIEDLQRTDGSRVAAPSWEWRETGKPSGYLTISLKSGQYGPAEIGTWSETAKLPLEKVLAQVAAAIRKHFFDAQERREREAVKRAKERAEWLERTREWERQEAIRLQGEKEQRHAHTLVAALQARKAALVKAAENWRINHILSEFIDACETRWKNQSGPPTPEQTAWLTWAREIAVCNIAIFGRLPRGGNRRSLRLDLGPPRRTLPPNPQL